MELSARFPSLKHREIYFPPPAKAGGPPFLSRTGNLRAPAPINSNSFFEIAFFPRYLYLRQKRKASKIFPSLEREGKGRKLCLLSANSYGIWDCVKRNVFFLQRVRMQKLIHRSMQNVFLSGERGGPSKMVESRIHYVNQKE